MIREFFRASACILLFLSPHLTLAEDTNFTTSHFSGSGNCATCHDGLTDTSGENVSIVRDWGTFHDGKRDQGSLLAGQGGNRVRRAKNLSTDLSTVINDTCSKCHAPMANYEITKVQGGERHAVWPRWRTEPQSRFI